LIFSTTGATEPLHANGNVRLLAKPRSNASEDTFPRRRPVSHATATQKRTGGVRRDWQTVVIEADGCAIRHGGRDFCLSENGVWLVERVPPRYLERL
jgi:RNA:NAD 2'-phosphotransferase (TPT1/KptA family)